MLEFIHNFRNKVKPELKKIKNEGKKSRVTHLTMMIIPHCQGQTVKNFCLPLWLVKIGAVVCVASVLTVGYFVSGYFYLQYIAQENKELRQINTAQAVEIKELKGLAGDMKNKLEALMQIDREVRTKVGLIKYKEQDTLKDLQTSRSLDSFTLLTLGLADRQAVSTNRYSKSYLEKGQNPSPQSATQRKEEDSALLRSAEEIETLEDLKAELAKMDRLLTDQSEAMDKLKFDVEKQIASERAIPEAWPIRGHITSGFGWRNNPFDNSSKEFHEGLDIDGSYGAPIQAASDGVVTFAGYNASWGNVVLISHGFGYVSKYAHNSSLLVKKGDKVEQGQIIARLGSTGRATGAHLHFGVAKNGEWIDPLTVLK